MEVRGNRGDGRQLELSKKIFELSTIAEIGKEFISSLDPERVNSKIVFTLMGVVGAKRGVLYSLKADTRHLEMLKAVNFPAGERPRAFDLDAAQSDALQRLRSPFFLSESGGEYAFIGTLVPAELVPDPLVIPLVAENSVLGLILLAEKLNTPYTEDDISILTSLAGYSSLALHRKTMVEMLVKSEKMAELGRLGAGIVHEIKNPLTSITMLSEMLKADKSLDVRQRKYVGIIGQEAQRILRLCQNLLSVSRPKKPEMVEVDLNRIVEETVALLAYELKKHRVMLKLDLQRGGAPAVGDEEKIKQVILNLVINAAHAMDGGGPLEISTGIGVPGKATGKVPKGSRRLILGEPGSSRMTILTIRDEGSGIEPAILDRIFEPFFTTKAEGMGTGLGLYVTRNIILDHHGTLTVLTCPGSGTTFRIALTRPPSARRRKP